MSKATEQAALLGIHNDYEISRRFGCPHNKRELQLPHIGYIPANNGRAAHYAMWAIYRPGYSTDLTAGYPAYNTQDRDGTLPRRAGADATAGHRDV